MSHRHDSSGESFTSFPLSTGDALEDSRTIQDLVSSLGFDWPHVRGVLDKVEEEIREVRDALEKQDVLHARRELGDVMFAVVNLSRFLNADITTVLSETNKRFMKRFTRMERRLHGMGLSVSASSFEELNAAWEKVKSDDK